MTPRQARDSGSVPAPPSDKPADHDDSSDGPWDYRNLGAHLTRIRERWLVLSPKGTLVSWSDQEYADRITATTGVGITRAYIATIMKGQQENIGLEKLVGLVGPFEGMVPPSYFLSARVRSRVDKKLDSRLAQLRRDQLALRSRPPGESRGRNTHEQRPQAGDSNLE